MTVGRRKLGLLFILVVALAVRLAVHDEFQSAADTYAPVVDSEAYLLQALRVAQGRDISDDIYFQAPLYPWVLGLTCRLLGTGTDLPVRDVERVEELPPEVVSEVRSVGACLNLILGLLVVAMVWRLGERLFSEGAGVVAGLLAALYAPSMFYEGHLLKVTLSLIFIPWAVLAAARAARRGTSRAWVWCGLALGLGSLVRGNLQVLIPVAVAGLLIAGLRAKRLGPAFAQAALLVLGVAMVLAPVAVRNSVVEGRPVLSTAAAGTAFWLCNNSGNSTGLVEFTPLNRQVPLHEHEDWTALTESSIGRSVTPAEVSSFWMRRAWNDISSDPGRWLFVELRKLGLLFSRYEAPDNTSFQMAEEESLVLSVTPSRYSTVLPLALGGMLLAWLWRHRREEGCRARQLGQRALALALIGYVASLLMFNMSSRFRMPVVVPAMVYAGYLLASLRALASRDVRGALRAALAAVVLLGLVLGHVSEGALGPLDDVEKSAHRVTRLMNRAQVALRRGDEAAARLDLQRALEMGRSVGKVAPDVLVLMGALDRNEAFRAEAAGNQEEATLARALSAKAMRLALDAQPAHGGAHRMAGMLDYDEGRWSAAAESFRSAIAQTPLDREARLMLVLSLLNMDSDQEALQEALSESISLIAHRPGHDDGHGLAAMAAWQLGREDAARVHLERYEALVEEGAGSARLPPQPLFAAMRRSGEFFESVDTSFASLQSGGERADTILEVNGGGMALFDADGDGDQDVLLVSPGAYPESGAVVGGTNRLYRNEGGWAFTDVTAGSGVDVPFWCNGVAVGDFDSDGRRDLYLTCHGPNVLLRNLGDMQFEVVPDAAGASGGTAWSTSAVFTDLDRDGDPDLYVANYLTLDPSSPPFHGKDGMTCAWKGMPVICGPQGLQPQADLYFRNEGGLFAEASMAQGFEAKPGFGLGVIDGDFNEDGWPDLYVSNDSTPNFLFLSDGEGGVQERGLLSGAALSSRGREQAGMGLAAGDLTGNQHEDLLVTNFSMEPNALYLNDGQAHFEDDSDPSGIGGSSRKRLGWGAAFVDVDLDGDLDVITANGHVYYQADEPGTDTSYAQPDSLWLNEGSGSFRVAAWPGEEPAVSRALATGDLDDDGLTDLVIARRSGAPAVWRGLGAGGQTLQLSLLGPAGNPDAVGAKVQFTDASGVRTWHVRASAGFQASADPRPVFAWRGPGQLRVQTLEGKQIEREILEPGRVELDVTGP
ncbi:MAG: FG-GAP-like repeat-containing protein [Planctomycetota bacterium]|nr:FG-GAP-like repeat-containing protein [Planctomycetota bacterium]